MAQGITPIAYRLGFFRVWDSLYTTDIYFDNYSFFFKSQVICLYVEGFFRRWMWNGKRSFFLHFLFSHVELGWSSGLLHLFVYVYNTKVPYFFWKLNRKLNRSLSLLSINKKKNYYIDPKKIFRKKKAAFRFSKLFSYRPFGVGSLKKSSLLKRFKVLLNCQNIFSLTRRQAIRVYGGYVTNGSFSRRRDYLAARGRYLYKFRHFFRVLFFRKGRNKVFGKRRFHKKHNNPFPKKGVGIKSNKPSKSFALARSRYRPKFTVANQNTLSIKSGRPNFRRFGNNSVPKHLNKRRASGVKRLGYRGSKNLFVRINLKKKVHLNYIRLFIFLKSVLAYRYYRSFYKYFFQIFMLKPLEASLRRFFLKDFFFFLGLHKLADARSSIVLKLKRLKPASLTADAISRHLWLKLRKRYHFASTINSLIRTFNRLDIFDGLLFKCNGRFTKKQKSWHSTFRTGRLSLSEQFSFVDDILIGIKLKFGMASIRLSINYKMDQHLKK